MLACKPWIRRFLAVFIGLCALQGGRARAASFEVSPIRVPLTEAAPNALLTIRNQSADVQRFQVTAFAWTQSPAGEMVLAPTQDVVVFPTLFALQPGASRTMRVGITTPVGGVERTYRVFVTELPPPAGGEPGKVRVLTRMGIPVFQSPAGAAPSAAIDAIGMQQNLLLFNVTNKGNAYVLPRHVRVVGFAADGSRAFERELPAWYVLAGGRRAYELDLPPEACGAVRLVASFETDAGTVTSSLPLPARSCAAH